MTTLDNQLRNMAQDEFAAKLFVAVLRKYLRGRVIEISSADLIAMEAAYLPAQPTLVLDFQTDPTKVGISVKSSAEVANGQV